MYLKISAALAATLVLAGCQMADITQPPVQYKATKKLDAKGVDSFTARTYVKTKDGRKEVTGVPCKLTSPAFTASFVTPAVVTTPDMGQRTPPGSITCTYEGKTELVVMQVMNKTTASIEARAHSRAAGAGLLGIVVAEISASNQKARRDATLDVYGYHAVNVEFDMRPKKPKK